MFCSSLKFMYSHRHYFDKDLKRELCDALVLSHFYYLDLVYGPCLTVCDRRRVQKVQNSCIRPIFGVPRRNRISSKLNEAKWLNMYNRRVLHSACFFYRILKTRTPPYLSDRVTFRTDAHNVDIRRKHNLLTMPQDRRELYKRSFSYNIAAVINRLGVPGFSISLSFVKRRVRDQLLQADS